MMDKDDKHIAFGIMGGANQPLAHAQFVTNIVDHHMNLQAALEAPRFTKNQATGCSLMIENRVGPDTLEALKTWATNSPSTAPSPAAWAAAPLSSTTSKLNELRRSRPPRRRRRHPRTLVESLAAPRRRLAFTHGSAGATSLLKSKV